MRAFAPPALVLAGLVLTLAPASSSLLPDPPGGSGTVNDTTENAFQHPFSDTSREQRRHFFVGNSFFRDVWVAAPSSTLGRDGLGPVYNAVSCSACHSLDGRGPAFTNEGKVHLSLLFRLSSFENGKLGDDPFFGGQFQPIGIEGVKGEGKVEVAFEPVKGRFPDGNAYELRYPIFRFEETSLPWRRETRFSPRQAPQLVGLGLLEAISEQDILALADPEDQDGDGISGRPNLVPDLSRGGELVLGRFGWKAGQPSLLQQNAAAFLGDIGITSSLFPSESCTSHQTDCLSAPNGGSPELSDLILQRVTTYTRLLAVPNRRIQEPAKVALGEARFTQVGCAKCHTPAFTTGSTHELELLRGQRIRPYTDLLLHDMGMELADHRPEGRANGREWKTPPLWGIGLLPTVNRHQNLLHDGRARGVEEAILWHGGEGNASREAYKNLSREEREALLAFVNSI